MGSWAAGPNIRIWTSITFCNLTFCQSLSKDLKIFVSLASFCRPPWNRGMECGEVRVTVRAWAVCAVCRARRARKEEYSSPRGSLL